MQIQSLLGKSLLLSLVLFIPEAAIAQVEPIPGGPIPGDSFNLNPNESREFQPFLNNPSGIRKIFSFVGQATNPNVNSTNLTIFFDYVDVDGQKKFTPETMSPLLGNNNNPQLISAKSTLDFCPPVVSIDFRASNLPINNISGAFAHLCVQKAPEIPLPNSKFGSPEGGVIPVDSIAPKIGFDSTTGKLSFADVTFNFANLVGNETFDPMFVSDPIIGATMSVTDLTLSGPIGNGFLFKNGILTISKNGQNFLTADIPSLLIDDEALSPFGNNIFGGLEITDFNLSSQFIQDYISFIADNPQFPPELFGRTSIPVTNLIRNNQSFESTLELQSIAASTKVPEPTSTLSFLALGTLGAASTLKRQIKSSKPSEKETTKVG